MICPKNSLCCSDEPDTGCNWSQNSELNYLFVFIFAYGYVFAGEFSERTIGSRSEKTAGVPEPGASYSKMNKPNIASGSQMAQKQIYPSA